MISSIGRAFPWIFNTLTPNICLIETQAPLSVNVMCPLLSSGLVFLS